MKKIVIMAICALCSMMVDAQEMSKDWQKIEATDLQCKPVDLFLNQWMALAMGNKDKMNSMTIAWGGIGELWNKNVVTVYVSSSRYSKHLMDENEYFTVTAFPDDEKSRNALMYIGTHSQKDEPDKTARAGLHTEFTPLGNPTFAEGNLTIECKKIYSDEFKPELMPEDVRNGMYGGGRMGYHTFYIGEIINVWKK